MRKLPPSITRPDYSEDGIPRSEYKFGSSARTISILNKEEIEGMRKVCRLAREVLDIAAAAVKPGVTTDEIDEIVHKACIERDVRFELLTFLLLFILSRPLGSSSCLQRDYWAEN